MFWRPLRGWPRPPMRASSWFFRIRTDTGKCTRLSRTHSCRKPSLIESALSTVNRDRPCCRWNQLFTTSTASLAEIDEPLLLATSANNQEAQVTREETRHSVREAGVSRIAIAIRMGSRSRLGWQRGWKDCSHESVTQIGFRGQSYLYGQNCPDE